MFMQLICALIHQRRKLNFFATVVATYGFFFFSFLSLLFFDLTPASIILWIDYIDACIGIKA